ncbi:MAG: 50S ribosomal protein L23 [Candidatus Colwellbacteria bacterium]|nr:50S ribosomal protein L23 [Candidatus Colwellbacteria bacterium]
MSLNKLVIKKPQVSEKGTDISKFGKYVFLVDKYARDKQIKDSIEKIYSVKVLRVNIVNVNSQDKRLKKAIVTLKEGDKIDIVPH